MRFDKLTALSLSALSSRPKGSRPKGKTEGHPDEQGLPTEASDQEHRLLAAGFGGQGILTIGRLLCMAAISEGKTVTYLPSYGAEVRGGTANCQVVISSGPIYSPLVEQADSLVILNQLSYDRFAVRAKPEGFIVVNSSAVELGHEPEGAKAAVLALPAADAAAEMGNVKVANSVMLGAFVRATAVVSEANCLAVVREHWTRRRADMVELNVEAFHKGVELAVRQARRPE